MTVDERFDNLAQDVSYRAAQIRCSAEAYIDGLRDIISTLELDIMGAESALADQRDELLDGEWE